MSNEGVQILLALESRQKPPVSEEEAEDLLKFFCGEEGYGAHQPGPTPTKHICSKEEEDGQD